MKLARKDRVLFLLSYTKGFNVNHRGHQVELTNIFVGNDLPR